TSGTLSFTDVNLSDTHNVSTEVVSAVWSGGKTIPAVSSTALEGAFSASLSTDSTRTGSGSVAWNFSVADSALDFLSAAESLTIKFTVTIDDAQDRVATQTVTIVITGADDAPVVTSGPASVGLNEQALTTGSS